MAIYGLHIAILRKVIAMPALDKVDTRILRELQRNARLTNQELAKKVGLSPAPCWRRLRRLEEDGLITRYCALLDAERVGFTITAYSHISLENHHPDSVKTFGDLVRERPEVLECHMMSGEYDYLLKVVARSMTDFQQFLTKYLLQNPAVRSVNTSFVLNQMKSTTALPVG
jgi:DNA-binding Lrp family transcriptional regulator